MNMNYEQKYLKYKQKYLDLQNVLKGGMISEITITKDNIKSYVGMPLILRKAIFDKLGVTCNKTPSGDTYESSNPDFSNYKFKVSNCNSAVAYVIISKK